MLKGKKSYIGVVLGAILIAVVGWSSTDGITWTTEWVSVASAAIVAWTGYAFRDAIRDPGK